MKMFAAFIVIGAIVAVNGDQDVCSKTACTSGDKAGRCRYKKNPGSFHCSGVSKDGNCPTDTIDIATESACINIKPQFSVKNSDITINTFSELTIMASRGKSLQMFSKIEAMDSETDSVKSSIFTLNNVLSKLQNDTTVKFKAADVAAAERAKTVVTNIAKAAAAAQKGDEVLSGKVDSLQKEVDNTITTKLGTVDSSLAELKKKVDKDVAANLKEINDLKKRVATEDVGKSKDNALATCQHILLGNPLAEDGKYFIDPNGGSKTDAFEVFCDMNNGGVVQIEPGQKFKTMPHKHYGKAGGGGGDGFSWASKMVGHPTARPVQYALPDNQIEALRQMSSSASQKVVLTCNGALSYRYAAQNSNTFVYSGAASFKADTGKVWETDYSKSRSQRDHNPYMSYSVGTDTCASNDAGKYGQTDFHFTTKEYEALPISDFSLVDFGDNNEKNGAVFGPVRFVVPARPKAGETYKTAAKSCLEILRLRPDAPDGLYFIKPANRAFLAKCDMTCSAATSVCTGRGHENAPGSNDNNGEVVPKPGWTCIEALRNVPYQNWYNGGDAYAWFSNAMNARKGWRTQYHIDGTSLIALQKDSSVAGQILIGHCRDAIMWGYGDQFQSGYSAATRFQGSSGQEWTYNSPLKFQPMVNNWEDDCRFNAQRGMYKRDKTTFRFQTGVTTALPIVDFAHQDHGSSNELTGMTIGAVCFN